MNTPEVSIANAMFSVSGRRAVQISAFFIVLTLVLLATPAAGLMRFGFPALALILACVSYRQSKSFYAGVIVWLWMLAPLVRRIVEYRSGVSGALIVGSPLIACVVPLVLNLGSIGNLVSTEGYPLILAGVGVAYGVGVAILLHNSVSLLATDLSLWTAPLLFAFFLIRFRFQITEIRISIERAFVWGTLVMGVYGLYQYLVLTPWDALWIETSNLVSIGTAEPGQMRVFSTMNSPQGFAAFMVAGILIAIRSRSKLKWLAIPFGSISLLLTQSRTAYLGFFFGFLYLLYRLPARQKIQIAVVGVLSTLLVIVALQGDQKDTLSTRLQTLTAPQEDGSFSTRLVGYGAMLPQMITNPFGLGVGLDPYLTEVNGEGLGTGDSGIIAILFALGIPGALMYSTGIVSALLLAFRRRSEPGTDELLAFWAIIVASSLSLLAANAVQGSGGFLTWTSLTLCYLGLPETFLGRVKSGSTQSYEFPDTYSGQIIVPTPLPPRIL